MRNFIVLLCLLIALLYLIVAIILINHKELTCAVILGLALILDAGIETLKKRYPK